MKYLVNCAVVWLLMVHLSAIVFADEPIGASNIDIIVSDSIDVNGDGVIYSYQSQLGLPDGANLGVDSILATNSTSGVKIVVHDSGTIEGNVYVGQDGNPDDMISVYGGGSITGILSALDNSIPIPTLNLPPAMPANSGSLSYGSGVHLLEGDYHASTLTATLGAILRVRGQVRILIDTTLSLDGATIEIMDGGSLVLWCQGDVTISGATKMNAGVGSPVGVSILNIGSHDICITGANTVVCAQILAPESTISVTNSAVLQGGYAGESIAIDSNAIVYLDRDTSPLEIDYDPAVFYVRSTGSDANTGRTAETAWRTIVKASRTLTSGQTVYVGAGEYNNYLWIHRSGTDSQPIRYIADTTGLWTGDPGTVLLKPRWGRAIHVINAHNIEIIGFDIVGRWAGILYYRSTGSVLRQCEIYNARDGVEAYFANITIDRCNIHSNCDDGIDVGRSSIVNIIDSEINSNHDNGIKCFDVSSEVHITRSSISQNGNMGCEFKSMSGTLANVKVAHNTNEGIKLGTSNTTSCTIWNSTIAYNGNDGIEQDGGTLHIYNSIIAHNSSDGLDRDGGTMTHAFNLVYGNGDEDYEGTVAGNSEVNEDPLFVSSSDLHLLLDSPAIDVGTDASEITTLDLQLNDRPNGNGWDLGCFEGDGVSLLFTDVSEYTGFNVQTTISKNQGSGFHWADLDNDGDLDVLITGGDSKILISNNEGQSYFATDMSTDAWRQVALLDIDDDADIDLWAACASSYNSESILLNDGDGGMVATGDIGFGQPTNNEGVVAADINLDGLCDIVMMSENGNWIGLNPGYDPPVLEGTDSESYGLNDSGDYGNGDYCSSADVNSDGYTDFFYHYNGGKLFLSNGDGTYTENASGISIVTGSNNKIGSAWGDYDNDGDLDLFVARYDEGSMGYLFENIDCQFVNVTSLAGLDDQSGQRSGCFGDYDNDGDLDLYIVTREDQANVLYSNDGDGTFTSVSIGADAVGDGHDAVFIDYDNDGDLDLSVTQESATNTLLRNDTDDHNYLKIQVVGSGAGATNRAGIGVRVDLYDSTGSTLLARRDVGCARGYAGSGGLWVHFGGIQPDAEYVVRAHFVTGTQEVHVIPSQTTTTIGDLEIAQMLTVDEADSAQSLQMVHWQEMRVGGD